MQIIWEKEKLKKQNSAFLIYKIYTFFIFLEDPSVGY